MSLINQMLRDLESRRTPELPGATINQARHSQRQGRWWMLALLLLLVVLLAGALGYTLWQQQQPPQVTATPAPAVEPVSVEKKRVAGAVERPRAKTTVIPPQRAKPQRQAQATVAMAAHLTAVVPAVVEGGWEPRTLELQGEGLGQGLRVVVSWGGREKVLAPERIRWLDQGRAEITLVTGNRDEVWQVALVMPNGSRTEAVTFEVVASESDDEQEQGHTAASVAQMEKRVRPVSDLQLAERLYQQGYAVLQRGDVTAAEQAWREALQKAPQHLASREGLIALYLSQGRKVEATKLLQQGVAQQPQNGKLSMLYARLLAEQGRAGEAITILEQATAAGDTPAELFAMAAALYQQQRNYDKSIASYQQALQLQPQQATWWMGLGISLEGAGREADAISAYREALQRGALGRGSRSYVEERLHQLD